MTDDDGFGPVQRGQGHSPRALDLNPKPRPRSRPDAYAEHGPADPGASPDEGGFAPPTKGRSRRVRVPGLRRTLRWTLLLLLIVVLAFIATGVGAALSANSKITREEVEGLRPAAGGQRNILLIGSDSRENLTRRERRRLGTGNSAEGTRTDTILLLSIKGSRAAMLSFPRDLYITRCDGSRGRINAAYGLGGPSCLVQTVTELSGIPITQFLEVDFLGFHDIVNAVGGVQMCLDKPIKDQDAAIDLPAGCQRLNGKEALGFVRVRKIDNDLGRIGRQQRFMKELAKEMARPSTLVNPRRLFSTGNAVGRALTADEGLGVLDLAAMARAGAAMGRTDFPTLAVPGTSGFVAGASVINIDQIEAEKVFQSFRDGSVLSESDGALRPEDIALEVRNAAGVEGLATTAADALRRKGFVVTAVGNAATVDTTVVLYTSGNRAKALYLAQQAPGGQVDIRETSDGPPLVLVLGRDARP